MSDTTPMEAPVKASRLKIILAFVIGGMLAFLGLTEREQLLLAPPWVRPVIVILIYAFYALEKYLQRSGQWKADDVIIDPSQK